MLSVWCLSVLMRKRLLQGDRRNLFMKVFCLGIMIQIWICKKRQGVLRLVLFLCMACKLWGHFFFSSHCQCSTRLSSHSLPTVSGHPASWQTWDFLRCTGGKLVHRLYFYMGLDNAHYHWVRGFCHFSASCQDNCFKIFLASTSINPSPETTKGLNACCCSLQGSR